MPAVQPSGLRAVRTAWRWGWPFVLALLLLATYWCVGIYRYDNWVLDLGSSDIPQPRYLAAYSFWFALGGPAIVLFAIGLARLLRGTSQGAAPHIPRRGCERLWLVGGSIAAVAVPLSLRAWLLDGAPVTDDESCYRFMAELLASGRVRATSHPLKLFFDHAFMINDGHLYAQYTLGWPALWVPFVWLNATGIANAVYSGLTVPALYLCARRVAGPRFAPYAVLLYLCSPMLMMAAATEMAHTTCLLALTWQLWFVLRSRDRAHRSPWWIHVGVAVTFSLAIFIRPQSAVGPGAVLLLWWALGLQPLSAAGRARAFFAFALPALLFALLFLGVNWRQNGSPWLLSYQRVISYAQENDFRFIPEQWTSAMRSEGKVHNFDFSSPGRALANNAMALFRLNADLFTWPVSLLFALLAIGVRGSGLHWWMAAGFLAVHFYVTQGGVDAFGPVHYLELALPILLLSVLGLQRLSAWSAALPASAGAHGAASPSFRPAAFPLALCLASILLSLGAFGAVRLEGVADAAEVVNRPRNALRERGIGNALVFVDGHYAPFCAQKVTRHFIYWWPLNDPGYKNDIIWANDLGDAENLALRKYFPDRQAYRMTWNTQDCTVDFIAVADGG